MPNRTPSKKIQACFYRSPGGAEPVRDWLKALGPEERKIIGADIATVEFGWPIGLPTCRALGGGLFEVRSALPSGRIARILFSTRAGNLVLLHGFIKKSQKAPPADLALAKRRMKELE